jgi:hypothetical protein
VSASTSSLPVPAHFTQCFSASGHLFEAFLEASFLEGFEFPEPSAEEVAAPESSVLMFSERASE